ELQGLSGSGWDDNGKQVDVDDIVYVEYIVKNPHCTKLNNVPFPLYGELAFVFGMEELNGVCEPTEDPERIMLDWINMEEPKERPEFGDEENNPNDHTTPPPMAEEQTPTGSEMSELKSILEDSISSLKSMLVESDAAHNQINTLYDELKKMDGLSIVMDATVALGKDDRILQIFFNMVDPEYRKCLVEQVIR
ncbi:hypothetical protein LINPERHAP2_LOCUS12641, partial [Linum perenne]